MISMSILLLSVADFLQSDDLEVFIRSHQDFIVFALDPHKDELILNENSVPMGRDLLRGAVLSW